MASLSVDIWSDIACPWCYVGKRRFEAALAQFPHREAVRLRWRSFELDPGAPRAAPDGPVPPYAERLARKYRASPAQAEQMVSNMTRVAAAEGLELRFERVRPGNTFDAHRLVHLAAARGRQDAMKERLMRGYFTEGLSMGDHEALARLAGEAGLDEEAARAVLASDAHAADVRADEDEAQAYGIHAVPFFAIGRYGVSGAQPPELLRRALDQAFAEVQEAAPQPVSAAPACGPDGCA